jgi:hypothetical protein
MVSLCECVRLFSTDVSVTERIYFKKLKGETGGRGVRGKRRVSCLKMACPNRTRYSYVNIATSEKCNVAMNPFRQSSFMQITVPHSEHGIAVTNRSCCLRNKRCLV